MQRWQLTGTPLNPPHGKRIPNRIASLKHYAIDMAYINPPWNTESLKTFKKRLYGVLHAMTTVQRRPPDLRVTQKHPSISWECVCVAQLTLCLVIRTPKIGMVYRDPLDRPNAGAISSHAFSRHRPLHPLWEIRLTLTQNHGMRWRPHHLEMDTSTDSCSVSHGSPHIPAERTMQPTFHFWVPQKHAAIIWITAHLVAYRMQTQNRLSLLGFTNVLRRARWKA